MIKQLIVLMLLIGISSAYVLPTGTFVNGTLNVNTTTTLNDTTISATKTLAVTTADKLTVGSVIVPQSDSFTISVDSNSSNMSKFIAPNACVITGIKSEVDIAGTYSSGNISCKILKLTGTNLVTTTSPGPISCLASGQAINLKDTPGTVRSNTLNATASSITLAAGDRLGILFNNKLTSAVASITITTRRA